MRPHAIPLERHVAFWVGIFVFAGVSLYALSGILLPFVAGMALAYLLDPLADRLQRLGFGRLGATIVILGLVVLLLALALILIIPLVIQQFGAFVEKLPDYVARLQALIADQGRPLLERFGGGDALASVQRSVGDLVAAGAAWIAAFVRSLWSGGQAIVGVLGLLVVMPVVAFYMLVDWDRMIIAIDSWIPPRSRGTVRELAREMDHAIAGFVRGQTTVCIVLGTFYAVGLSLIGLNFGAIIGMIAGLISFIPYVGSLTGLFLALAVALVQFWPDWTWIVATLVIFFTGQFFEGNILSPKLVGASVGLHPVWVMFALFAFGAIFGFVGLLLAVPLAAMIGVLCRFGLRRYLASPLFSNDGLELVVQTKDQGPAILHTRADETGAALRISDA